MPQFADNERLIYLLKEYQFRAYDRPLPKRGMTPLCQNEIADCLKDKKNYEKELNTPFEQRKPTGFKKEKQTDDTLNQLIICTDKYIEFKKKCLENHVKAHNDPKHRARMDKELKPLEEELAVIVCDMTEGIFRRFFGGYSNFWKTELMSRAHAAFWSKLTKFNIERDKPFSYYTSVIRKCMVGFISEFHSQKKTTMSLSVFTDTDSA